MYYTEIDDLKIYADNEKELKYLIIITKEFSQDIKMKFRIEKCKILHVKKDKIKKHNNRNKSDEERKI